MALPESFRGRLRLPVVAAPMFLVSSPELVIEGCRSGVIGTLPALNFRTSEQFEQALQLFHDKLDDSHAPWGVNLIMHESNTRLEEDLALLEKYQAPLVITSLGINEAVIKRVQAWGGVVFHDIAMLRHAQKAAAAGVDGIIAVAGGAGGHAGVINPFALVKEIRSFFDGTLLLAGAISQGEQILAAQLLGADLAYLGTRFIVANESWAAPEYKQMVTETSSSDIVYTSAVSGVGANFMAPSLAQAGLDPKALALKPFGGKLKDLQDEAKAWKNIWSAGQGVGSIKQTAPIAEIVGQLEKEYQQAFRHADDLRP
ncbi:NAD(P)H-dependent flavin oxidoreductase [Idiomarina xiamenensis]|uniref:2-nitropropane dioxygenase n=1 Tax=Idiomarina xiamenensis 10-D-4 TaxID=740709 RepID=K2JVS3_9GAMM|nr:nitronate monooxygenase [Idiomarina xiamenensis]EKE87511.1 2-nitropropane dioxygenase [Idiomarina xiamenensis 10-D-4]